MVIPEIITGVAVLNGVKDNGSAITLSYIASFQLERMEAEQAFGGYEVKDALGNTVAIVAFDEMGHVTVDLIPSSSTRAIAATLTGLPIPLSSITIGNCLVNTGFTSSGGTPPLFNGAHVYRGGARLLQQSGQALKMTGVKLDVWANATQNTALNTTVVG